MKIIRRIIVVLLVLAVAAGLAAWGLLTYIKPQRQLDLAYTELSLESQLVDIIRSKKPEVRLSNEEINQLGKKAIAKHARVSPDVTITGADFTRSGDNLTADVNLLWKNTVPVGAQMTFKLAWTGKELAVTHTGTHIRNFEVPSGLVSLAPVSISLDSYLPSIVHIKDVRFDPDFVVIGLTLR
ncbi:hypothetical protein ACI48J_05590 [Paenibacillus chitinolyticus]|uniref:hypothetical protein n=1 Tax=Paenibacillus chitinolyticus TaxID=79263 RepID=UPI003864AA74